VVLERLGERYTWTLREENGEGKQEREDPAPKKVSKEMPEKMWGETGNAFGVGGGGHSLFWEGRKKKIEVGRFGGLSGEGKWPRATC